MGTTTVKVDTITAKLDSVTGLKPYLHSFYQGVLNVTAIEGDILIIGGSEYEAFACLALGADNVHVANPWFGNDEYRRKIENIENINIHFHDCFAETIELKESSIDLVLSCCVVEHIINIPAVLEKIYHVLKPKGKAVINGGPVWTSYIGHHLWVVKDGVRYCFNESLENQVVQGWEHLYYTQDQLEEKLIERSVPTEHRKEIIELIYFSDKINRLSPSEIEKYVNDSSMDCLYFTRVKSGPVATREILAATKGKYSLQDLNTVSIRMCLQKTKTVEKGDRSGRNNLIEMQRNKYIQGGREARDVLGDYLDAGNRTVEGWLTNIAARVITELSEFQVQHKISGSICEIGVHHGRLFILLHLLSANNELSVAYDLFERQGENIDNSGEGNREILEKNLQMHGCDMARILVRQANSMKLSEGQILHDLDSKNVRMFSVDGGHTAEITVNDLSLAEKTICDGGIIILDDLFNEGWPGVAEGTFKYFFEKKPKLFPVAIVGNKVIFTNNKDTAQIYQKHIYHKWKGFYLKKSLLFDHEVVIFIRPMSKK